jgi:hypothetical protein
MLPECGPGYSTHNDFALWPVDGVTGLNLLALHDRLAVQEAANDVGEALPQRDLHDDIGRILSAIAPCFNVSASAWRRIGHGSRRFIHAGPDLRPPHPEKYG